MKKFVMDSFILYEGDFMSIIHVDFKALIVHLTNKTLFLRILNYCYQIDSLRKKMTDFIINYNGFENVPKRLKSLLLIKKERLLSSNTSEIINIDYELMIASKCKLISNNCK
jgi:hypothetical protein